MKRSSRQVKPNSKYFDESFKSPRLDVMMSNKPSDDIDASAPGLVDGDSSKGEEIMEVDFKAADVKAEKEMDTEGRISEEGSDDVINTAVPKSSAVTTDASKAPSESSARPSRHIKPNSKYLNSPVQQVSPPPQAYNVKDEPKSDKMAAQASASVPSPSKTGRRARFASRQPRQSATPVSKEQDFVDDDDDSDPKRPCGRAGCPDKAPMCFASASSRCTGNKYTSRWHHISQGEHYCNECFESLRDKNGSRSLKQESETLKKYEAWKAVWSSKARQPPSVALFLVDQVLPYWARCRTCSKWRQLMRGLTLTPAVLSTFTCAVLASRGNKVKQKDQDTACDAPEDRRVEAVCSSDGFYRSQPAPMLSQSVAAQFLTKYHADGVGLSPTESVKPISKEEKRKLCPFIVPFAREDRPLHAFAVTPDCMLETEVREFPIMAQKCPQLYLGLRNLTLAIWALNAKERVTVERVEEHVVCRGLSRVACVEILPRLVSFLTRHGYINQGLPVMEVIEPTRQASVVVIGAGASGLAAARCLLSQGVTVTVLEAKYSVGGRASKESSHLGFEMLNGCWNNPLAILAYQAGIELLPQPDNCRLITAHGQKVPEDLDRRIEFHYNAILDIVSDWRRGRTEDVPLIEKFKEFHEEFIRETQVHLSESVFSQQEVCRLVNFYLSNLEFALGCSLSEVSSLCWDQNEDLPQFGGMKMEVAGGVGSILDLLTPGLDIRLGCQVSKVSYPVSESVSVSTNQGEFTADKVIVTVPLTVLQKEVITFDPPLPEFKVKAIQSLGAGKVEKVSLEFAEDFWSEKIEEDKLFGHVPESEDHMGFFNVFYCRTLKQSETFLLTSHLVGHGLGLMEGKKEEEIVEACLGVLRNLFPEKTVPPPLSWSVSSWCQDAHTGMAYSYLPVGASGDTYDDMAAPVASRIFFAGEATSRQFSQTVTGAYMSGLREAWNVLDNLET